MVTDHDSRLREALERGDEEAAAQALAQGAAPDAVMRDGSPALAYAAMLGKTRLVRVLLAAGANPTVVGADGMSAARLARLRGHTEAAVLLERAARAADQDFGRLALDVWGGGVASRWQQILERGGTRASPGPDARTRTPGGQAPGPAETPDARPPKEIRLEDLVGQKQAKAALRQIIALNQVNRERAKRGLAPQDVTRHAIFAGNPGTGKTTFARYYGQEIKKLGILRSGHLVEVSRQQLVAEYEGQTAPRTQRVVEQARGGILFIDEAYALKQAKDDRFGQEAIDTLLKLMEDWRDDLVVILAGYTDRMREFMLLNPGLQSRIPSWITFEDFTDPELGEIFDQMLRKGNMSVAPADRALLLEQVYRRRKGRYFGNAREVRNLFERALAQQSARLARSDLAAVPSDELGRLTTADITEDLEDGPTKGGGAEPAAVTTALTRLEGLRGLAAVKQEIREFAAYVQVQRARGVAGGAARTGLNFVFSGNPGTGKTTVARLLGEILREIGVLPTGHLVEVDRSRLVAGYQGQTAIQTREAVEEALGGVLFVDEAYALAGGHTHDDAYGREAIDALVKLIEDHRGQLAVVLAGYQDEMERFLSVNTGMRSRITHVLHFPDYTDEELIEIASDLARSDGYRIDNEATSKVREFIAGKRQKSGFGNAREVRAILETTYRAQAARIASKGDPAKLGREELDTLAVADFERAASKLG